MDVMSVSSKLAKVNLFAPENRATAAVILAALIGAIFAMHQLMRVVIKPSGKGNNGKKKATRAQNGNGASQPSARVAGQQGVKATSGKPAAKASNGKQAEPAAKEQIRKHANVPGDHSSEDEDEPAVAKTTGKMRGNKFVALETELPYIVPSDDGKWETVVVKKPTSSKPAAGTGNGASAGARGAALSGNQQKNAKRAEKRDLIRDLMQESVERLKESKLSTKAKVKRIPPANNYVIGADFT